MPITTTSRAGADFARSIVFIDSGAPNTAFLVDGVNPDTSAILLDSRRSALAQIADAVERGGPFDAIHIVAHGAPGEIHFASGTVSRASLDDDAADLARIGAALGVDGHVLLWSCEAGRGAAGAGFLDAFAAACGAAVAASTHRIGAAERGGDWTLDAFTAPVTAQPPFTHATLASFSGVLATPVIDLNGAVTGGTGVAASYTEQAVAVSIAPSLEITDADGGDLQSATVAITAGRRTGDTLVFSNQLGITGVYDGNTGILALTGTTTLANYQIALRTIGFRNLADNDPTAAGAVPTRTVSWTVTDAGAGSTTSTPALATINIGAVNDGPGLVNPLGQTTSEDTPKVISGGGGAAASFTVSDFDAGTQNIQVTLSVTNGILDVKTDVAGGVTQSQVSGDTTGTVVITATQAQINATMNDGAGPGGLTYIPKINYTGADTLVITANDRGHTGTDPGTTGDATSEQASINVGITVNAASSDTLAAQQTVAHAAGGDVDGDGRFDQGDTVAVSVKIANNSAGTIATGVELGENLSGLTFVDNSVTITPLAFDDAISNVSGNTPIVLSTLLANDIDPDASTPFSNVGLTISSVDTTGTAGTVVINSGGAGVTFTPTTGFTGQTSFKYFVTDADGLVSNEAATVTVNVNGGQVWYVDGDYAGANGASDGSFLKPFTSLAPLNNNGSDADGANDTIFVYDRGGTYTGSITLENGQKLLGDGSALTSVNGNLVGASANNSDLANSGNVLVTLGQNNTVSGLDLGNSSTAISGSLFGTLDVSATTIGTNGQALSLANGAFGTGASFSSITSSGGTNNIALSTITGTVNLGGGALSGATGNAFNVSGGTLSATYSGNITQTAVASPMVNVIGHSTGTLTFATGTLSSSSGGLTFDNADGAYDFNGTTTLSGTSTGIVIQNGSGGTFSFGTGTSITDATNPAFNLLNSTANVTYSGDITQTNTNTLVSVLNEAGGTVTFESGTLSATSGNGLRFDNADNSVNFNGTTTLNGGAAGITIVTGSSGTFNFGSGTSITSPTVAAFNADASSANVSFNGTITQNNVAGAIVATNNTGGTLDFNGLVTANTGGAVGVNLTGNAGATIRFDGGLNIDTTSGVGFSATKGAAANAGTIAVSATGGDESINSTVGQALNLSDVTIGTGGFNLDSVNSGGGANNIKLQSVTGSAVSLGSGTISGSTTAAFLVGDGSGTANTGGTAAISYSGSIASTGTARAVDIEDRASGADNITLGGTITHSSGNANVIFVDQTAAGTITFSGANSVLNGGSSNAVNLTNNTGATISFTGGGLDIDTTTGVGFNATNGGTVSVTGSGNSINSVSNTALNVVNTGIASSGITFQRIDAGNNTAAADPVNGIVLNNTGTAGGLTVTGDGTPGSGGTIQNSTADGIVLNSTSHVVLQRMVISGADEDGIHGTNVNNFTFRDSTISGFGNGTSGDTEDGMDFTNLSGTVVIQRSTIGAQEPDPSPPGPDNKGIVVRNTDAADLTMTVTGSTFTGIDNDGIDVQIQGQIGTPDAAYEARLFVDGTADGPNVFSNINGRAIAFGSTADSLTNGDLLLKVNDNTFTTVGTAASWAAQGGTDVDAVFRDNTLSNVSDDAIRSLADPSAVSFGASTSVDATIEGNDFGGGSAFIAAHLGATSNVLFGGETAGQTGNTNIGGIGVNLEASDAGVLNIDVLNNVVVADGDLDPLAALFAQTVNNGDGNPTLTANIQGNTFLVSGNVGDVVADVYLSNVDGTLRLQGFGGGDPTAFLTGTNTFSPDDGLLDVAFDGTISAFNGVGDDAVPTGGPVANPLLAASAPVDTSADRAPPAAPVDESETTVPDDVTAAEVIPAAPVAAPAIQDSPPPSSSEAAAAAPAPSVIVDDGVLSQAELDFTVSAAKARWTAAGLTGEQIAALDAVTFSLESMPGLYLAAATPAAIRFDTDGAGHGWFIDATPQEDGEFTQILNATRLQALSGDAPAGRVDLLTTVMHEMGHVIGIEDSYSLAERSTLMYGYLATGERRLPGGGDADGAVAGSIDHEEFALGTISVGAIPVGRTVTVSFQATIDTGPTNQLVVNPSSQGTLSATNASGFGDVNTNQSVVTLDTLVLGDIVFDDTDFDGTFDPGEGVGGVALTLFADTNGSDTFDPATDVQLATTTTAAGGVYSFTGLASGSYIVRVDQSNFNAGGALLGRLAIAGAVDPDDNSDTDSNGSMFATHGAVSQAITLTFNGETTADSTGQLDINNTLDFGFIANSPPVIDNLAGDTSTFVEDGPAVLLDDSSGPEIAVTVTDANNITFSGGSVTVSITGNKVAAEDVLGFSAGTVTLSNGTNVNSTVTIGATAIGTIATSGTGAGADNLIVSLNANATPANVSTLLQALTYANGNTVNPSTLQRTISVTVADGLGGVDSENVLVNVSAVNDAAIARNDAFSTAENAALAGGANVLSDNGSGADSDEENDAITVALINGSASIGSLFVLPSGAQVTLNADGTLSYDPNGQFNALGGPGAGGGNTATDVFSYTLAGGSTANVTVTIVGVDSDDTLNGTSGDNMLDGGVGNDQMNGLGGDDNLEGRSGDDTLSGGADEDALSGGDGNDTLFGGDGDDTLYGDPGDDMLDGQDGDDILDGGGGNDSLEGRLGSDTLFGRSGNNVMSGGDGDDTLWGGVGADTLYGDDGNDRLDGQDGDDILVGGQGDDRLEGRLGNDTLFGRSGNNVLSGGDGDDTLWGGAGDDRLYGDDGNDKLDAQNGDDILVGGQGDDTLDGDEGADILFGGSGNDILRGGGGSDTLDGGDGLDTFVYTAASDGNDTITDFVLGAGGDVLELSEVLTAFGAPHDLTALADGFVAFVSVLGSTLVLADSDGTAGVNLPQLLATLNNVTLTSADTANFVL